MKNFSYYDQGMHSTFEEITDRIELIAVGSLYYSIMTLFFIVLLPITLPVTVYVFFRRRNR